jgi:hypothetical protein
MTYESTSFSITYTVNGVTYNLDGYDATTGLTLGYMGNQGFGLPPITRIVKRGTQQNGDTNVDYRIDPRVLSVALHIQCDNYVDHLRACEKLGQIFRVGNSAGTLTVVYSYTISGTTTAYSRSIDCYVAGGLDLGGLDYQDFDINTSVTLRASDPMWYDSNPVVVSISQSITGTPTPIPFLVPMTMGGASLNKSTDITYVGSAVEYPIITIVAGVSDLTGLNITNVSTGKTLQFSTLTANRTYTVDLSYGVKTITDDLGFNCIGLMSASSNLNTWGIDPNTAGGVNTISVSSSTANVGSVLTLTFYNRYTSI